MIHVWQKIATQNDKIIPQLVKKFSQLVVEGSYGSIRIFLKCVYSKVHSTNEAYMPEERKEYPVG